MSFRRKRAKREPGEKRIERVKAQALQAARWKLGMIRPAEHRGFKIATGLKRQFVPGSEFEGQGVHTPYFARELRRRRAARRVSHESRRANR